VRRPVPHCVGVMKVLGFPVQFAHISPVCAFKPVRTVNSDRKNEHSFTSIISLGC
jgi:hypothetical protein